MRYAIFSDIQGNRTAWNAVAEDMRRQGVRERVCLGDVVGCGPLPREVLRSVRETTGPMVLGDCDATVAGLRNDPGPGNGMARVLEWTRNRLQADDLEFLASLPPSTKAGGMMFTHAETEEATRFGVIDDVGKAGRNLAASGHHVTFVGHGYHPAIFMRNESGAVVELPAHDCRLLDGRPYLVNVGSVGIPAGPNDFRARYAIYDSDSRELLFRHVPFPPGACRNDWTTAGLPLPPWLGAADPAAGAAAVPPPQNHGTPPNPTASGQSRAPLVAAIATVVVLAVTVVSLAGVVVLKLIRASGRPPVVVVEPEVTAAPGPAPKPLPKPPSKAGPDRRPDVGAHAAADPSPPEPPDPRPAHETETPKVVVVPKPAPKPPRPPEPTPAPPPSGPPPIPPEPADAANTTPLTRGLVFYAPLDEPENEFIARDLVGERDLDVSGGLPGSLGRVGFAVGLERQNSSDALLSKPEPLPAMKALTISFWIKRPAPAADNGAGGRNAPRTEPPMNLVSLKNYCDVRLENNQVVADMDRKAEAARVAFPPGSDWHHVLVENSGGRTSIWIDHRSPSKPVGEKLSTPPGEGVAVQIGSKNAHFHIDEVAVWNRKFSPAERQILYRNGRLDIPVLTPPKVIARWKFDDRFPSRILADTTGDHPLGAFKPWSPLPAIAPGLVPLTEQPNPQAARVWQLSERPEDAGSFQMHAGTAFTYEGWMRLAPGSTVLLGGVLPGTDEGSRGGWRLEARPGEGVTGDLVFTYQSGPVTVEAAAREIPIYFGRPHHFAAVWNPRATPALGTMELFLDNKAVATASLPLSEVGAPSEAPFRIVAAKLPVELDEVRFTTGSLKPDEFLTAGRSTPTTGAVTRVPDTPPADETPMERSAREARERREREAERREERRREEEAKRDRSNR